METIKQFEIRSIQWMEMNRQHNASPHRHNHFEITWVKQGRGTCTVDMQHFNVSGNAVFCAAPGQVHQLELEDNTEGYTLSFNNEFLFLSDDHSDLFMRNTLINRSSGSFFASPCSEAIGDMGEVIMKMVREFENYFSLRTEILRGYFRIFMIYLRRQFDQKEETLLVSRNAEVVRKFYALLDAHYTESKMVTDYARLLAVSPNYLNEIVKRHSGYSASHHIQQRVVLEAKRNAVYTNASMKEIAYKLGFDDIAHFSKYFKNVCGVNFTDYKKSTSRIMV